MANLRPLTFRDIMESDPFYYDENLEEECSNFCKILNIDYLPTAFDNNSYYKHKNGVFDSPSRITENQKVKADDGIFKRDVLDKFSTVKHNVLFVYENLSLVGVVHIADYNKPVVLLNYYGYLLDFEQGLRELLVLSEIDQEEVIAFFKRESEIKSKSKSRIRRTAHYKDAYEKCQKREFMKRLKLNSPFQLFPLPDLLNFAAFRKVLDISNHDIDILRKLRNSVMHGQDSVSFEENLYSYKSLDDHYKRIQVFTIYHNQIKEKIKLILRKNQMIKNSLKLKTLEKFSPKLIGSNQLMWKYLEKNR